MDNRGYVMQKMMAVLLLFIGFSLNVFSEINKNENLQLKNEYKLRDFQFEDTAKCAALLSIGFLSDEYIRNVLKEKATDINMKKISSKVSDVGMALGALPIAGFFAGKLLNDENLCDSSFTAGESLVAASTLTLILKYIIGRERPDAASNSQTYKPFTSAFAEPWESFPSGHATIAWSVITPYAIYYKNDWLYLIPTAVSLARVYDEKHWTSDVIMGSCIGFATGYIISKNNLENVEFNGKSVVFKF